MLIIVLSLTGIIGVISVWLYGSYSSRLEIALVEVERSLFNAVQNYYVSHEDSIKFNNNVSFRNFETANVTRELSKAHKGLDSVKTKMILDSMIRERFTEAAGKKANLEHHRSMIPSFLLQQIVFGDSTLSDIDHLLKDNLADKGIFFDVNVLLETLQEKPRENRRRVYLDSLGYINTRPILVNSQRNEFLVAKFKPPYAHVFGKMFWQLVVAFVLVFALMGTFGYLLWTINRQNKLALLRKSFVNNMTHELKTPVSTVMAAIEAVQRYGAKNDKAKMEKYLQISQRELTHLTNMIEKVLQLDIDEVKGIVFQKVPFDITVLLKEVIELCELGASKQLTINFNKIGDSFIINADPAHLKNVFSNLLDNAIKYSGSTVQIDIQVKKISTKIIEIEIKDNGIGIAPNYIKSVFDMFFRVPHGEIHSVKGFGLGLAYVKQVVEKHNGSIQVTSELNKGTSFIIKLPQ